MSQNRAWTQTALSGDEFANHESTACCYESISILNHPWLAICISPNSADWHYKNCMPIGWEHLEYKLKTKSEKEHPIITYLLIYLFIYLFIYVFIYSISLRWMDFKERSTLGGSLYTNWNQFRTKTINHSAIKRWITPEVLNWFQLVHIYLCFYFIHLFIHFEYISYVFFNAEWRTAMWKFFTKQNQTSINFICMKVVCCR